MVGSPNYVFMVYDGDQSGFPAPGRAGPGRVRSQIEDLFESYYTLAGEPYDDAEFSGRSDYQAFILNGIPAGGLFTGAEVVKTAGAAGDLGRHRRCPVRPVLPPGVRHVRQQQRPRLDVNSDAIAFAVLTYAYSTETVNGVPGTEGAWQLHDPGPGRP